VTSHRQLSCYVRTKNEERMIGNVLDQVKKLTDNIVVVDSGSSDKTEDIVRSKGAVFLSQEWLGWGYQKLVGQNACSTDWVLDLDADEVLSDELIEEITELFRTDPDKETVFSLELITVPPYGEYWYKSNVVRRDRIYNRNYYSAPKHEAWDQLPKDQIKKRVQLKGPLFHFSFPSAEHMIGKYNSTSSKFAQTAKLKPEMNLRIRILLAIPIYFSKHYFIKGLWRQGIYGFSVSMITAFGRWMRDVKMLELHMIEKGLRNTEYDD